MTALERWRSHPLATLLLLLGIALIAGDAWRWWSWHQAHVDRGSYRSRADWDAPYGGGIHLSGYAFRDLNRDGRLDLGDRPMAWVAFQVTQSDGKRSLVRTNLTGFANFETSLRQWDAVIRRPGDYTFRVLVPPGWRVTSGNAVQKVHLDVLHGAPADLVAKVPPAPVGLAPRLTLAGRCTVRRPDGSLVAAAATEIAANGPDGQRISTRVHPDGRFEFPVSPGTWRLLVSGPARAEPLQREITVRDAPIYVAGLVLNEKSPPRAGRLQRFDFDSVTPLNIARIPSGVAGLDWDYLNAIDVISAGGDGYVNALASGRYVGYSCSGYPVTISRSGGFDFYGAYVGAGLPPAEGETLHTEAFRGGRLVASDDLVLSVLGPVWLDADYRDVDRVVLSTRHYWQFAIDDLLYSTREGAAAPATAPRPSSPH